MNNKYTTSFIPLVSGKYIPVDTAYKGFLKKRNFISAPIFIENKTSIVVKLKIEKNSNNDIVISNIYFIPKNIKKEQNFQYFIFSDRYWHAVEFNKQIVLSSYSKYGIQIPLQKGANGGMYSDDLLFNIELYYDEKKYDKGAIPIVSLGELRKNFTDDFTSKEYTFEVIFENN